MDLIYYFGSLILGLGFLVVQGLIAWALIEAGWWIYTKLTGQEY